MRDNLTRYHSLFSDSARWNDFPFRSGDIVISTPPKCGTTWMQMICALLIFQTPDLGRPLTDISPWLDMLTQGKDRVFADLAAQSHRRFIKTHTPLDGLPLDDRATYICVGRDPRDAAVSFLNHRANIDPEAVRIALQTAAHDDGREEVSLPQPRPFPETIEAHFWQWVDDPTPVTEAGSSLRSTLNHYNEAFRERDRSNVVVVHYSDLKADLEGEMRGLAARLGIVIPEERWPELVAAASFASMRARGAELAPDSTQKLWKDPQEFFHSGTGGHWREFFDDATQQRYAASIAALTSPEVAAWAHAGGACARSSRHMNVPG